MDYDLAKLAQKEIFIAHMGKSKVLQTLTNSPHRNGGW
jgi:hypothetical protein